MIDGSEKRKRQLVFELQSSRVYEKRSNFYFTLFHLSLYWLFWYWDLHVEDKVNKVVTCKLLSYFCSVNWLCRALIAVGAFLTDADRSPWKSQSEFCVVRATYKLTYQITGKWQNFPRKLAVNDNYKKRNQHESLITTHRRDLLKPLKKAPVSLEGHDKGEKCKR